MQALPTETAAALGELRQKRKRSGDEAAQPGQKRRRKPTKPTTKKKPATRRRRSALKKNERSENESESDDEEDDGPVFTSRFQASYWSEPQEVAKLRETIRKADKILEKLSQVEYMRKNTQTLLSTIRSSSLTTSVALLAFSSHPLLSHTCMCGGALRVAA
jgi:hypothetical protein